MYWTFPVPFAVTLIVDCNSDTDDAGTTTLNDSFALTANSPLYLNSFPPFTIFVFDGALDNVTL